MRALFLLLLVAVSFSANALEAVTIQLNWKHQFQFAGYYVAIEKGYFRDAGFDVTLRELGSGEDPVDLVLAGKADYGVAASELALHRGRGKPIVAVAAIIQNSPLVLLVNRKKVSSIEALNNGGAKIMLMPHEAELYAYLKREGIERYTVIPHSFDPDDLISGRVDALSGYSTDEPFILRQHDFPYLVFTPRAVGINFYGDTLFTSEERSKRQPSEVRAFRDAAVKGWAYAMEHPQEAAELILRRYSNRHSLAHLLFEAAEMKRLMQPELIELGTQSAQRWQQIARTYAELQMLPTNVSMDGLIFDSGSRRLPVWVWPAFALGAVLLTAVLLVAWHFAKLNRLLRAEAASRREAEFALRQSEERYRQLAEHSKDVIWTLDLASLRFTYVSPSIRNVRGYTAEEVMRQSLQEALTAESYCHAMAILQEHLQRLGEGDMSALSATTEIEQPHKNGGVIVSEVVASFVLDETGQPQTVLGIARDISERRAVESQLRSANDRLRGQLQEIEKLQAALKEQAIRDSLTGCFNRRYLDETLERELWRARREGYPLALVILDLDHFKQINDTYGHLAGDLALKELAGQLQADVRHEDVLCRYGGEEFVILMPRMALATALERAEAWRQRIADIRIQFGNFELSFTASAGVAAYPDHGKTPDELAQAADEALYVAKREGRNRVVAYRVTEG
ncbi:diguanylate cyclase [Azonexus sp. IMCC34839]|uniref:diguanylate cyclase n=1 Tax=Azonexus sp. IMCC34839 TaxID=3133695 RepID=UPI00399AE265